MRLPWVVLHLGRIRLFLGAMITISRYGALVANRRELLYPPCCYACHRGSFVSLSSVVLSFVLIVTFSLICLPYQLLFAYSSVLVRWSLCVIRFTPFLGGIPDFLSKYNYWFSVLSTYLRSTRMMRGPWTISILVWLEKNPQFEKKGMQSYRGSPSGSGYLTYIFILQCGPRYKCRSCWSSSLFFR